MPIIISTPSAHVRAGLIIVLGSELGLALAGPARAQANLQVPAPSQVTPRTIAPAPPSTPPMALQPPPADLPPPPADEPRIAVGEVRIEGAFPGMTAAHSRFVAATAHRRLTGTEIFAAARRLEQDYALRGYLLARVVVPPQRLEDGAALRVLVVDGFIESCDLSHLAAPLRRPVGARLQGLIRRPRITLGEIERAMLLASDVAGARLRSAIAPGTETGGVRLVVQGQLARIEGQITAENSLPASLGRWQLTGTLAVNGPLGRGDQLYLAAGSDARLGRYGFPRSALGLLGLGYVLPLDQNGTTLTAELLTSRTHPLAQPGVPTSTGHFTRALLRLRVPAIRGRDQTLNLSSSIETVTQSQSLPQFGTALSRDHYYAWRIAADWQRTAGAVPLFVSATLSQGLSGRKGTAALPVSRQGAASGFTNLEGSAQVLLPVPAGFTIGLVARGKTGFGKPQLLSEQFALDSANAVSAFPGGSFNVDSGATLRGELQLPPVRTDADHTFAPYLFAARGWGRLARATALEQRFVTAGAAGVGARLRWRGTPLPRAVETSLGIELGRQFSNVPGRATGNRVAFTAGLRF